ncbi:NifB/NifX family molybdenum-iron cluster-binding protein [Desulfopila inferna]|uniref:NifB/NifX family molybdenum-iron cluster-binding protein n=1 Tax=Desulfopila inferna TaxID=468528 RepID=UPI00196515DC|nr:NifB/NifX family molybdenum-iron cluster-binding protein [Desulfopila inferna]MBM9603546.1 NifB/NifX family molybdenum-iron cluster-binding protein [Desulfopila inferna]
MKTMRVAIPSNGLGGLDGTRAGHFGHCDVFTVIDCQNGEIVDVTTIKNEEHVQGGCMVPVNLLAGHKVDALLVGGIGMRPLMGFKEAGIRVYHEAERAEIRAVIDDLIAGRIPEIRSDQVCGGGGGQ